MKRVRNFFRYIIVIALDVFMMVTFHSYINFLILIALLLFPVYSVIGVRMAASHLKLEVKLPHEPMDKKSVFHVCFLIHNETVFPILNGNLTTMVENRFYQYYGDHTLNVPLRAKGVTEVEYPVEMEYCGRFVVSVSRIKLWDLTGIYETTIPLSLEKECLVVPHGTAMSQEAGVLYQQGMTEAVESKAKGYDFSEVSGIREYIPGDKLQNIHWKLSSKRDLLMVKERVTISSQQLNVVLDLLNDEHMCLEDSLELFDGVMRGFVAWNLPVIVIFYSQKNAELIETDVNNEEERKKCMELILYHHSYKEAGLVGDVYEKKYPQGAYLYIGTCNDGENVIAELGNSVAQLKRI